MRILFTSVGRPRIDTANGVELEIYRLAETLASQGNAVLLVCITRLDPWPVPGVEVRAFRPDLTTFLVPRTLKRSVLRWRPDVAVISSAYTPFNARFAAWCRRESLPYVVRPCGGYGLLNERVHGWKKRPFKALFEMPMLDGALYVWGAGDQEDIRLYGTKAPIVATPRGLDLPNIGPVSRSEVEVLRGLDNRFVFGFLGRLDPMHKGLDLVIEAFRRLKHDDAALVLVGPVNSGVQKLFDRMLAKAEPERIRLAGALFGDDRDRFLGGIDAFVHTSRWEGGVPNSVIQAAAMARPLLLTHQADPAEMLFEGGGCVRVKLDPDSIAEGMQKLIGMSPSERVEMGSRAARSVLSRFGWEKMAQGFIQGLHDHGVV